MTRSHRWWRRHFLGVELALALCLWCAVVIYVFEWGGSADLRSVLDENRANLHMTLAMAATTLLGLSVATLTVTAGYVASPRLEVVRNSRHYPQVGKIFTQSIGALGALALSSFVSLVFDTQHGNSVVFAVVQLLFFLVAAIRVWRSIWVVQRMVSIVYQVPRSRSDNPDP